MLSLLKSFGGAVLKWATGDTLDRVLTTIDKRADNETERERIRSQAFAEYLKAHVAVATGKGWWFPLFFVIPLGFWFASVCIYSVLWCADCVYPQGWTIAALPSPLDEWGGAIVGSLFLAKGVEAASRLWRK